MIDKEKFAKLLEEKLEEGYEVVRNVNISSEDCRRAIVNMFEIEATIKGLRNIGKEVQELNAYDKEREEIENALAKNVEVEVNTESEVEE